MNASTASTDTREAIQQRILECVARIPSQDLPHFAHTVELLAQCYLHPASHGALLTCDQNETCSLASIHATHEQITELVGFMAESLGPAGDRLQGSLN